ncbi:MAG: hypothetical protein ABEJ07_00100 [Candidatus Nanohaloarchaea archaeon]
MKQAAALVFLAVLASGCIHVSAPASEPRFASCDDVQLKIDEASSSVAMVRQVNNRSIGEAELRWEYSDGSTATKSINLSERGTLRMVQSGSSGELERFTATPLRCPARSETYTP